MVQLIHFPVLSLLVKTRLEMHKALEQDSSVYDYDAVYDDIQKQRLETNKKLLGGADKKVMSFCHLYGCISPRQHFKGIQSETVQWVLKICWGQIRIVLWCCCFVDIEF